MNATCAGGTVVDKAVNRLSICLSVPEIFALKFESCPKSWRILDVLLLSQILRERCPPQKNLYARYQVHLSLHHVANLH